MRKKCRGCGIDLQSADSGKPGYVPMALLEQEEDIICQRCYRLKNYARFEPLDFSKEDYLKTVKEGINRAEVIVYVVDIIDFAGSWQPEIISLFQGKPWILAVSKTDLLPKKTGTDEIKKWLEGQLLISHRPVKTVLLSSRKKSGIEELKNSWKRFLGPNRTVAIVGMTNAGKSSLLNCLSGEENATVSKFPGTTLGVTVFNLLLEKVKLLDTPGLIPEGRMSDLLCPDCNLQLIPAKEISRKTYKLKDGQVLFLGGLASFTVLEGENAVVLAFAASGVKFHRTRWERREELLRERAGDLLYPPCSSCVSSLPELVTEKVTLNSGEDLAIAGLGWLSVRRGPVTAELTLPEKVKWQKRSALINPSEERKGKNESYRRKN